MGWPSSYTLQQQLRVSGFFVVVGAADVAAIDPHQAKSFTDLLASRGYGNVAVQHEHDCLFTVSRSDWESRCDLGGATLVARTADTLVATDASLYYRQELLSSLLRVGIQPRSLDPAHMVLAAYLAFGSRVLEHIEGDYAFVLWNRARHELLAARDPFGSRPLYWSKLPQQGLALASSPLPLLRLQGDRVRINPEGVLRSLTLRPGDGSATAWVGIHELPAGHHLRYGREEVSVERFWDPQVPQWEGIGSPEAAREELAHLLEESAVQRLGVEGAAVAMSGGRDSTAVLGSIETRRQSDPALASLSVLSFRYPKDDPGNEDRYVAMMADFWDIGIEWIDTEQLPLMDEPRVSARRRSLPLPLAYETQNRALARAARDSGKRVLLSGHGGDNVFLASDDLFSDLFRTGRWFELRRQWRRGGYRGWQAFKNACVRPMLAGKVFDLLDTFRAEPISRPYAVPLPPWIPTRIIEAFGIDAADAATTHREILSRTRLASARSRLWAVLYPAFAQNCAGLHELGLQHEVEVRFPILDRRVVDFALSRPAHELRNGAENKVLLRGAMKGRVPDGILAPRRHRTGTADGFFAKRLPKEVAPLAPFLQKGSTLEALGLVDGDRLRLELAKLLEGDIRYGLPLYMTLLVELWLREWNGQGGTS